jgi:TonB-linked SusC/RagA family outer membrane protein
LHDAGGLILAQRDNWESVSGEIPYNVVSLAARATYNYDSRYFGEVNMGYNGSEQFSPTKRFGFFPAFSLGWVISNENFLQDNDVLTYLKLRGSMGRVGNDKIGGNRFLYLDNTTMGTGYLGSLSQGAGINEGLLGNPELTWELAQKSNIGIDFQIFKDLIGTVDVFTEDRTQILLNRRSIPNWQGLSSGIPLVNMGEVKNRGFEVELSYTKQVTSDLLLTARGNFSYNRNKLIFVDEVPLDNTYKYQTRQTGFPLGQEFGYEINWNQDGGYWTPDALAATGLTYDFGTPRPGDFVYIDANEDGKINEKDMVPIGHGNIPRISWGASLSAQYKGFDAYLFFQGLAQFDTRMSSQGTYENIIRGTYFDYHRTAWTEERYQSGEKITYPALSVGETVNHVANSFFIQNRSFVRLKNFELGYTLPQNLLTAVGVKQMRVFVSGQNVLTWSPKFRTYHLDPENDSSLGYPQTKMFSFGTNITF